MTAASHQYIVLSLLSVHQLFFSSMSTMSIMTSLVIIFSVTCVRFYMAAMSSCEWSRPLILPSCTSPSPTRFSSAKSFQVFFNLCKAWVKDIPKKTERWRVTDSQPANFSTNSEELNTQHAVSLPSLGVVLHNLHTVCLVIYCFLLATFNIQKQKRLWLQWLPHMCLLIRIGCFNEMRSKKIPRT